MRSLPMLRGLAGKAKQRELATVAGLKESRPSAPLGLSPVSPPSPCYRIGTTLRSRATLIALAERLPVAAF